MIADYRKTCSAVQFAQELRDRASRSGGELVENDRRGAVARLVAGGHDLVLRDLMMPA